MDAMAATTFRDLCDEAGIGPDTTDFLLAGIEESGLLLITNRAPVDNPLPTQGQKRAVPDAFLLALRDCPGEWRVALTDPSGPKVRGIAFRINNWGSYGGGYEAKVVTDSTTPDFELRLRWVGKEAA